MKLFEIKHRFTGEILFKLETESLKLCVEAAVKGGANLGGANLGGANLRGANLRDADLYGADLVGAYLRGANLRGANLRDADLRDADLRGADLRDADLRGADLLGADLVGAYLRGADLLGADLVGADLRGANLCGADLRDADLYGANLHGADLGGANLGGAYLGGAASPEQAIHNLDKVREIILEAQELLDMDHWHARDSKWQENTCSEEVACGTTHCLAGWLQVCSTDKDIRELPAVTAGIILAPVAAGMFYESNERTLQWLRDREYAKEE